MSHNALEDKGLSTLNTSLQQRKSPLISINLQSCSLTQKSLYHFHTALVTNNYLLRNLKILNLAGNRIKEENVREDQQKKTSFSFQRNSLSLVYSNSISK